MPSQTPICPVDGLADQRHGTWQPLLLGAMRERALEAAYALADRLCALSEANADGARPTPNDAGDRSESLAGGAAGLAVLFAYLSRVRNDRSDEALAATLLDRAITAAAAAPAEAALYSGLAGAGWATAHLRTRFLPPDGEDVNDEIDEVLSEHVAQSPWKDDYDLINGLVGFGVYALERLPRPAAVRSLERVIQRLAEMAEHRPGGVTWWTNPAWLPDEMRDKFPHGYYNTGLAHGLPGVIALLGCACTAGVAEDRARPLLDDAVRWLLAQQLPEGFPAWLAPEAPREPARLAWCYGDPGVAVSLLWTARCVNEPAWEREALSIARRAAQRPAGKSGVVDAGLCHGASGLGHIFNRLYQATARNDSPTLPASGSSEPWHCGTPSAASPAMPPGCRALPETKMAGSMTRAS
jgi:hypothetical protein